MQAWRGRSVLGGGKRVGVESAEDGILSEQAARGSVQLRCNQCIDEVVMFVATMCNLTRSRRSTSSKGHVRKIVLPHSRFSSSYSSCSSSSSHTTILLGLETARKPSRVIRPEAGRSIIPCDCSVQTARVMLQRQPQTESFGLLLLLLSNPHSSHDYNPARLPTAGDFEFYIRLLRAS